MLGSALRVSFLQALRSVLLLLFPLAFASLVIWATAGSGVGKTSDPLRASIWLWLVANHVPFKSENLEVTTWLSFLPIGSLFLIYLIIRTALRRTVLRIQPKTIRQTNQILFAIAFSYAVISTLLAIGTSQPIVNFPWFLTFPITFCEAFVFAYLAFKLQHQASELQPNHAHNKPWQFGVKVSVLIIALIWGAASITTALSLAMHFSSVRDLTTVIQPGIFGGLTFLIIQILYLPNVTMATFSYLIGAGFHLGTGSWVHPLVHRLAEIPALPILGALPTQRNGFILLCAVIPVIIGVLVTLQGRSKFAGVERKQFFFSTVVTTAAITLILALISSGSLLNVNLAYIGISWWMFPTLFTTELMAGMGIGIVIGNLIGRDKMVR